MPEKVTTHAIYRVRLFESVALYTLCVQFDDRTEQVINFEPVLAGERFRPLRDLVLFNQVQIDPEVHTLVWPNGEISIRQRCTTGQNTLRLLRLASGK